MNIRILTEEKKDVSLATLIRNYNIKQLSFNKEVLKIYDGEQQLKFNNVKNFTIEK